MNVALFIFLALLALGIICIIATVIIGTSFPIENPMPVLVFFSMVAAAGAIGAIGCGLYMAAVSYAGVQ